MRDGDVYWGLCGDQLMMKKTYKIQGMHCTSCAIVIESDLADKGVAARCSYVKETLEVEFDPKKVSEKEIRSTVAASGYHIT